MNDYKPNSHKSKQEQEARAEKGKFESVVSGGVKTRKKSDIRGRANDIKNYVVGDVLVPSAKKTLFDIIKLGAEMFLFGESTGRRGDGRSGAPKISYRDFYGRREDDRRPTVSRPTSRFDYDDIIFESRGDATVVLDLMQGAIDTYGVVTVADMYDMANLTEPYTANRYGWTSLKNADVVPVRGGFVIDLPKAMPID